MNITRFWQRRTMTAQAPETTRTVSVGGSRRPVMAGLLVAALVAGGALVGAPGQARADWDDHRGWDHHWDRGHWDHGWGDRGWDHRHYWGRPGWGGPVVVAPGYYPPPVAYVAPPPPVYYAPRPVIVAPPPPVFGGLTVVLPIH